MDDVKLLPCPMCGGLPVMLIKPTWEYGRLRVECSVCGRYGPNVFFEPGKKIYQGRKMQLLPGLAKARRQAAAAWNEEAAACRNQVDGS